MLGEHWMESATCRSMDPEAWFPLAGGGANKKTRLAIDTCRNVCPVRRECIEYAIGFPQSETHGIWGGFTSVELATLRRRLRRVRARERAEAEAGAATLFEVSA